VDERTVGAPSRIRAARAGDGRPAGGSDKACREPSASDRELVELANSMILRWDVNGHIEFCQASTRDDSSDTRGRDSRQDVMMLVPEADSESAATCAKLDPARSYSDPGGYVWNENENVT